MWLLSFPEMLHFLWNYIYITNMSFLRNVLQIPPFNKHKLVRPVQEMFSRKGQIPKIAAMLRIH